MSSASRNRGLTVVGHLSGGTPNRLTEAVMSTAIDTIGEGDAVRFSSGRVMLATAGTRLVGLFAGYRAVKSDGTPEYGNYYASGSISGARELVALITTDPNLLYEIQSTGAVTTSDINKNADLAAHSAANAQTKRSTVGLANSMTTGAAQFRIVEIFKAADNEAADSYTRVVVKINEHQFGPTGVEGETA